MIKNEKKLYQYTHKYFQNNIKTVKKILPPPQKMRCGVVQIRFFITDKFYICKHFLYISNIQYSLPFFFFKSSKASHLPITVAFVYVLIFPSVQGSLNKNYKLLLDKVDQWDFLCTRWEIPSHAKQYIPVKH